MANNYLLYETENFLLLDKPHGMPTVPLKEQGLEGTLLEQAALLCPQVLDVKGKNPWEGGALHRLDTATAGIVIFAKTQGFYENMQICQENNEFEKYYMATTFENNNLKGLDIEKNDGIIVISSYFRPFGPGSKEVRPTLNKKKASPKTIYETAVTREKNLFYCTITKGFRHQIRAHLAWTGHPIVGDAIYGNDKDKTLQLECVGVRFASYEFLKAKAVELAFPKLSRFANSSGNVIIQL